MSNVKDILKEHSELLLESGIKIPKGTHAAKIIYHSDLDGVFSAILTMNQLIKQGIPKNRIVLSTIDYKKKPEEVRKRLTSSKGQMVALVDFSRLLKREKESLIFGVIIMLKNQFLVKKHTHLD